MKKYYIVVNEEKDPRHEKVNKIKTCLEKNDNCVIICNYKDSLNFDEDANMAIVLGGDGTVINVAKKTAGSNVPILGINMGTLGFLSEIDNRDEDFYLDKILNGDYQVEDRVILEAGTNFDSEPRYAVNEIVVGKKDIGRLITTKVYVDGKLLDTYAGDGVIVATPTGSTAYNLSAGGPILSPDMSALVITPVCPHSLAQRSLVVSADATIKINIVRTKEGYTDEASVRCDGEVSWNARTDDEIVIKTSKNRFRMVNLAGVCFYEKMRGKLG